MRYDTTKTTERNLCRLIGEGLPLPYTHTYFGGMEHAEHELDLPDTLAKLATKCPDAEVAICGDGTLIIEISGKIWAAEDACAERGTLRTLPRECWQYLHLALGHEIDDVRFGDTCGA